jgi:hypothetical protein
MRTHEGSFHMGNPKQMTAIAVLIFGLSLTFQNCSKVKFADATASDPAVKLAAMGDGQAADLGDEEGADVDLGDEEGSAGGAGGGGGGVADEEGDEADADDEEGAGGVAGNEEEEADDEGEVEDDEVCIGNGIKVPASVVQQCSDGDFKCLVVCDKGTSKTITFKQGRQLIPAGAQPGVCK